VRRLAFLEAKHLPEALLAAASVVRVGGVVLVPTDTYYGLGGAPNSERAVDRIRAMKNRPPGMGLPILCADWIQLEELASVPEVHREGLSKNWPGALTAVLPSRGGLHAAEGSTIAVRIPGHPLLRSLLSRVGPLTGTSANRHGEDPPADVESALRSIVHSPDLVLDGGRTPGEGASTVVELVTATPRVLRQGVVEWF
jgi:tRNA threonylcarbamoyl adenosine modification protein (Sua5/YciO/YrdC/YwlC family)